MIEKYKKILILISFIVTLFTINSYSNDIKKIQIIKDNYFIDTLKLHDFEKNSVLLKDKKASYYLLNFWASWCAPCIKEMKSLDNLQKKESRIRVITISQDSNIELAKKFFIENSYTNLEKYFDIDKKVLSFFNIRGLPTTFIVNEDFKVFAKVEGIIEWDRKSFINWLFKN
tara:strand:- start:888 stop:1403 length:516 start_codon:yes stop_codon:yes gene_type:complete